MVIKTKGFQKCIRTPCIDNIMYIHKYIPIMYVDIILVQKEVYLGVSP